MKKIILCFFSAAILFFYACSNDSKEEIKYPTINAIPESIFQGEELTVIGTTFTGNISVKLNGSEITLTSLSNTEIRFLIPENTLEPFEKERDVAIYNNG